MKKKTVFLSLYNETFSYVLLSYQRFFFFVLLREITCVFSVKNVKLPLILFNPFR